MEDEKIIKLFFDRSEDAIKELSDKYGNYLRSISYSILQDAGMSEECVNDALLRAWYRIPPAEPVSLKAYVGKAARNIALDKLDYETAKKRGGSETVLCLDELSECVGEDDVAAGVYESQITEIMNAFLAGLPAEKRKLFVRRYWYMDSIKKLSESFAMGESNVKTTLSRLRKDLKEKMEQEGVNI